MKKISSLVLLILIPYFIYSQQCVRDTSLYDFQYIAPSSFGWTMASVDSKVGYMRGQSLYLKACLIECQQDNKMIIVSDKYTNQSYITRSDENGKVDISFANNGGFLINTLLPTNGTIYGLKIYQNNIYVAVTDMYYANNNSVSLNYLVGLDANGYPLSSFGNNGVVLLDTNLHRLAYTSMNMDASGNIFLAGSNLGSGKIDITKIDVATGSEITSFGNNGVGSISTTGDPEIKSILIDNGEILVSGSRYGTGDIVAKFSAIGAADLSFNGTGFKIFNHPTYTHEDQSNIHKTKNGNYILTGSVYDNNTWREMVYALEFNNQGVINTSYGNNGWFITDNGVTSSYGAVKSHLLDDDRLIISSMKELHKTVSQVDSSKVAILMLKADGTLDNTFAPNGIFYDQILFRNYPEFIAEHRVSGMTIDKKGKLIIIGQGQDCLHSNCWQDGFLARYVFQTPTTSADEYTAQINVSLYPNPTTRKVTIDLGMVLTNVNVILTNNLGQEISTQLSKATDRINLDIDSPAGIYFLSIKSNNRYVKTIKVIKD